MSMTPIELARRASEYAAAVDRLTAMRSYRDNLPADASYDLQVRFEMHWGSSNTGYRDVVEAVRRHIKDNVRSLIDAAIEDAVAEERRLRTELVEAVQS